MGLLACAQHRRGGVRAACTRCLSSGRIPFADRFYYRRMPLLLIPLLVMGAVALWALLLPFALIQRYRHGKARRRIQGWVVHVNAWLLLLSVAALFVYTYHALIKAKKG